jgi:hypothetical protein
MVKLGALHEREELTDRPPVRRNGTAARLYRIGDSL